MAILLQVVCCYRVFLVRFVIEPHYRRRSFWRSSVLYCSTRRGIFIDLVLPHCLWPPILGVRVVRVSSQCALELF